MTHPQTTTTTPQNIPQVTDIPELALFECLMDYVQCWDQHQQRYRAWFAYDVRLSAAEIERFCQQVERTAVLAMALQHFAQRLAQDAEETTDRFHTWLTD